jgi:hypothetical protein
MYCFIGSPYTSLGRHAGAGSRQRPARTVRRPLLCSASVTLDGEPRGEQRKRLDAEFRALQKEYAGIPHLHIYNSDDYELDPRGLQWDWDMHGRDRNALREALASRDTPVGFGDAPLSLSDIHGDDEDLASFAAKARYVDPNGNRVWRDPMPASDFVGRGADDDDWKLHFREVPADEESTLEDSEAVLASLARPYAGFASEELETAALMDALDAADLDAMMRSGAEDRLVCHDDTPVPDPKLYAKWQAEAEARGGNASLGDSHALSPAKRSTNYDVLVERARTTGVAKPDAAPTRSNPDASAAPPSAPKIAPQHKTLADVHVGEWAGVLTVFAVDDCAQARAESRSESQDDGDSESDGGEGDEGDDGKGSAGGGGGGSGNEDEDVGDQMSDGPGDDINSDSSRLEKSLTPGVLSVDMTSVVSEAADGSIVWSLVCRAVESNVTFGVAGPDADSLRPGRAVFADGSYLSHRLPLDSASGDVYENGVKREKPERDENLSALSLSDAAVASAIGSDRTADGAVGVAELCTMSADGLRRQRVVLCEQEGILTHVVAICEVRGNGPKALALARELGGTRARLQDSLVGHWSGTGTSLHPYFPPYPTAEMKSTVDMFRVSEAPKPRELTYVKDDVSSASAAMASSSTPPRSAVLRPRQREKLSKRVTAALKRDEARLAACRLVCAELLQGAEGEQTAWEEARGGLRSPRLGPRAPDYFALALPGGGAIVTAIGRWEPGVRCRVELIHASELQAESNDGTARARLIGARNVDGNFTGIALLSERLGEEAGKKHSDE